MRIFHVSPPPAPVKGLAIQVMVDSKLAAQKAAAGPWDRVLEIVQTANTTSHVESHQQQQMDAQRAQKFDELVRTELKYVADLTLFLNVSCSRFVFVVCVDLSVL